jgi:F-type H+-transporting ATPase subunit gamma
MANLKEIRIRLNSVKSTRQITSAMKMVSAAKLRKAQESILQLRPFYLKLHEVLQHVTANMDDDHENEYSRSADYGRVLLVVITSNRGLCGAFNSNIVKKAIQSIQQQYLEAYRTGKLDIIAIGKKGADMLKSKNYKVTAVYHNLFDRLTFENVREAADMLMHDFTGGKYGVVKLIYNQFRNAAVQDVTEEFFLPVLQTRETEDRYESHFDYIFEPSNVEIFDEMIPYALRIQFFRSLLESSASEHGARMTAMHKATDNATELIKELELTYNKARQAAITKEILEIVGGADALKG